MPGNRCPQSKWFLHSGNIDDDHNADDNEKPQATTTVIILQQLFKINRSM